MNFQLKNYGEIRPISAHDSLFNPDMLLKLLSLNSCLLKVVSSQVISVNLKPLKRFISALKN